LQSVQKKLASKVEALMAVSEDLAKCQTERDRWRATAQNFERNLSRVEANFHQYQQVFIHLFF